MSNSPLVDYKRLSPNCTKLRKKKISKIVIHHMAGKLSVETCGSVFASSSRQASSNYGVGNDGRIGMYVEEKNRSWATANAAVDHEAVTIEVANSKTGGNWPVSDKALQATIDLCVDICKRNGIKKLKYTGGKDGNLLMHCWYANTSCPGPYLKSKFPYIAEQVNKKLGASTKPAKLKEDGEWGKLTTIASQYVMKTTQDGEVSNQLESCKEYLPNCDTGSWEFVKKSCGGSALIKAIQELVGAKEDGEAGKNTAYDMQKFLAGKGFYVGTYTKKLDKATVKAWQKYINSKL